MRSRKQSLAVAYVLATCPALPLLPGGACIAVAQEIGARTPLPSVSAPRGPDQAADIELPAVFVTGSNIPTVDRETALPVQVITRDAIQRANLQTAAQIAATISASVSYGAFSENRSFASSSIPGVTGVGLRGLSDQRTLVLINGRRIANYAFSGTVTDLNIIPVAAIERVEVLLDGASAIYGSDAIGGVINFVLLQEYRGVEAVAQYSAPEQSGGWSQQFTVTGGYGSLAEQKFNVYGMIDYQRFGALAARDRDFSRSYYIPGAFNQAGPAGFPGNVPVPGGDFRNPTGDPARGYQNPTCAPPMSFPTNPFPNRCNFDAAYFLNSINASERWAATGALTWQVAPGHVVFAQALYSRNEFTFVASPTSFADRFFLRPDSPFYPHDFAAAFGRDGYDLNTYWRPVELGGRTSQPVLQQWNVVAGAKGTAAGWGYDTAFTYGVNRIDDRYTGGYLLGSRIQPLIDSGRIDPFGYNTPDVVAQMRDAQVQGTIRTGDSTLLMLDARAWKPIVDLPAGPLVLALGVEGRQWRLVQDASDALASRDIVGMQLKSMNASRDIGAVFVEANAPVFDTLEVNLAARYDHYSDIGSTINPKVSLRWQPHPTLVLRSSAGTGFRAPSLEAMYAPPTTVGSQPYVDPARCPTTRLQSDCGAPFPLIAGGNPDLKSETSSQWGIGGVWSPIRDLTMSVDYYDVIVDEITLGANSSTILTYCPDGINGPTCQRVVRAPPQPPYLEIPGPILFLDTRLLNAGRVRTKGIDVTARYQSPPLAAGQFGVGFAGTYIIDYLQQQTDGSYVNYVNHVQNIGPYGTVPYWHHYLTLDWNNGAWAATLTQNFLQGTYDAFAEGGTRISPLRKVGSYEIWNLSGSWSGFAGWQLSAGIKNLMDRDPPFTNQTFTAGAGAAAGYDPGYANPIGRVFWAALRYRFK